MKAGLAAWRRSAAVLRTFAARHWQDLLAWRERWRVSEETFHLALAALVGIVGGLANLGFYVCTESLKWLALRRPGDLVEVAEMYEPFSRFAIPALGGLAAGLVLHWGLRLVGTAGSTNLLEVVVAGDGRLPLRSVLIKVLSSLLSISTGASIGREGSIVHLGATLASKGGQWAHWPPYRLRLLLACGAAAGMAAAYNAPVAGAVFAAQIVLGNFSMNLFAPLLCSSVVACMVSRTFFGIEAWYRVPGFDFTRVTQLPWFLVLGACAGALGALFLKALRSAERFFQRLGLPLYARLTLAGMLVGAIAVAYPEVWGNGYSVTSRLLDDQYQAIFPTQLGLIGFLLGLLVAKLSATALCVGAGTVGGVFTPTLFLGAALGSIFGHALHALGPAQALPTGAFALVGMGGLVAATTHSPLLAMIMIFEISLDYSVMPPLMLACAVATLVGRRLHPASIYTEPLRQKGLAVPETDQVGSATQLTVGDLMNAPVPPLRETACLREIADRFLVSPNNFLPVVDAQERLLGMVALQDLKGYLNAGPELRAIIAADVMRPPPLCLTPNQRLQDALPVLLASELRNIPVVSDKQRCRLVGSVPRAEALARLSEAIAQRTTTAG
jgi:CIC family chloride channel protein